LRAGADDVVLDAGVEKLGDDLINDGEALGLDEGAGVFGDGVEAFLQRHIGWAIAVHNSIVADCETASL
jgi:hypothetical protein